MSYLVGGGIIPITGGVPLNNIVIHTTEPKWVPVEKGLPEESGEYYVTWTCDDRKRAVGICEYEIDELVPDGMWWPETYMKSYPGWKVVAWMPLPDAYKGGANDE